MKKFTDGHGSVWAFEADGSQDAFIPRGLMPITEAQALAILNPAPTIVQAQATQIALISAACGAAVIAGLNSSALGAAHSYPTKPNDQQNLSSSVLASLMPNNQAGWTTQLLCADTNGNWAFVAHSASQVQQVGQDIKALITAMIVKYTTLAGQVMAASTVAAVQNINWS